MIDDVRQMFGLEDDVENEDEQNQDDDLTLSTRYEVLKSMESLR